MKLVINKCFGGFRLSREAIEAIHIKKGNDCNVYELERSDKDLVLTVEELGLRANGLFAELKVVEIPDDIEGYIDEYDGLESFHEEHRVWE